MRHAIAAATLLVMIAAPSSGRDPVPSVGAVYVCDGGAVLRVAYVNANSGESFAVVDWGGYLVPMRQVPSGSGALYEAVDDEASLRWFSRGDGGMLHEGSAGDEVMLLVGCARV